MSDERMPELRHPPGNAVDEDVSPMPDGQRDGPTVLVSLVPVLVDPDLAVAVEQRLSETAHRHVLAAE